MGMSEVSNMAIVLLLLLIVFLSGLADIGYNYKAPSGHCQAMNLEGNTITKGLNPMLGRCKMTGKKAGRTQLGMAQASSEVKHGTRNEAEGTQAIAQNKETKSASSSSADRAKAAYENAKDRVDETYQTAKETMTESARNEYENAKEKASKATGDLGAKMREEKEEL